MKKTRKIVIYLSILLIIILGSVVLLYHIFMINNKYPNPKINIFHMNDEVLIEDNKVVKVKECALYSLDKVHKLYPEYDFQNENIYTDDESVKMFLVKVEISDTSDNKAEVDLSNFILQSGAWANGWDLELYSIINQKKLSIVSEQKSKVIYLPYFLYDFQFSEKDWRNIEKRKFCLVTSVYPEKRIIELMKKEK